MCAKIESESKLFELQESCSQNESSADLKRKRLVRGIRATVRAVKLASHHYNSLNQKFLDSILYK